MASETAQRPAAPAAPKTAGITWETWPLARLRPAPYNPRKPLRPGDPEYAALKRSIQTWDYVDPIIVNRRTGHVVGGHQRLAVLRDLGYTEAAVSVVDLDETQEKALNLALNRIQGAWDETALATLLQELEGALQDLTITGFTADEVEALLAGADAPRQETSPAVIYPLDAIVEAAFAYFRTRGFPYRTMPLHVAMQEINALAALGDEELLHSDRGYQVADAYHPHRFAAHAEGMKSPCCVARAAWPWNTARWELDISRS